MQKMLSGCLMVLFSLTILACKMSNTNTDMKSSSIHSESTSTNSMLSQIKELNEPIDYSRNLEEIYNHAVWSQTISNDEREKAFLFLEKKGYADAIIQLFYGYTIGYKINKNCFKANQYLIKLKKSKAHDESYYSSYLGGGYCPNF